MAEPTPNYGRPTETGELRPLTDEDREDLREAFDNFDLNGDGTVDRDELATVMRSLGYSPTTQQLQDMINRVDKDDDGVISFEEFVMMMQVSNLKTDFEEEIKAAFKHFDSDNDGTIDRNELATVMRALNARLSDAEIDLLVKEADQDGNGVIDMPEFIHVIYSSIE